MKNRTKKKLFWVIPFLTSVCSIVYIGLAINQNKEFVFEKTETVRAIAKAIEK